MKHFKLLFCCLVFLFSLMCFAGGPPPHHHNRNHHNNSGLDLAAGIINLVSYGLYILTPPPSTIVVSNPQPTVEVDTVVVKPGSTISIESTKPVIINQPSTVVPQPVIYYNYPNHYRYYYNLPPRLHHYNKRRHHR